MRQHQDGREGARVVCGGDVCVRARKSEGEREREFVDARMREESAERGGGLCSETETNDHEHQITHISTQSQRYRKEDQRVGTAVHACTAGNKEMTRRC